MIMMQMIANSYRSAESGIRIMTDPGLARIRSHWKHWDLANRITGRRGLQVQAPLTGEGLGDVNAVSATNYCLVYCLV